MPNKDFILSILDDLTTGNSSSENKPLNAYLNEDSKLSQEADLYKSIWNDAASYKSNISFDKKKAFADFKAKINAQNQGSTGQISDTTLTPTPAPTPVIQLFQTRRILAIAASVTLLIVAGFLFLNDTSPSFIENTTSFASNEILSDGTKLILAPGSKIAVDESFGQKNRLTSQSQGQIYFDVTDNDALPFTVDLGDASIEVVGTSFNVKINDQIQIDLIEGKINFIHKGKEISLEAGEQILFNPENGSIQLNKEIDQNAIKWISNGLSFDGASINKVLSDIESFYGVNIDIKTDVPTDCHFTSPDLTNVSLNDLFVILLSAQGMVFDKHNDKEYSLIQITCKK